MSILHFVAIILATAARGDAGVISQQNFIGKTCPPQNSRYLSEYTYSEELGGWVKLHRELLTLREARLRCNTEGAILASPINEQFLDAMQYILNKTGLDCIRTGIHDTIAKGEFFSLEGVPLSEIPACWSETKSQDFNSIILSRNGTIAKDEVNSRRAFMCFKKKIEKMVLNTCGMDDTYEFFSETGSCYKFHLDCLTWPQAFKVCAAEGGHLAIINSEAEAELLKNMFTKYPRDKIQSDHKDSAMLGFYDWTNEGNWRTIQEQTLDDAGYAHWSANQPDNAGSNQHCGGMFRTGQLDDVWCNQNFAYICEKLPSDLFAQTIY